MTIAFYTCVASYLFARDLPLLGTAHFLTDACNKNWWTNVLYINNLIGYDEPVNGSKFAYFGLKFSYFEAKFQMMSK
jgi:hypothetical protein